MSLKRDCSQFVKVRFDVTAGGGGLGGGVELVRPCYFDVNMNASQIHGYLGRGKQSLLLVTSVANVCIIITLSSRSFEGSSSFDPYFPQRS